MNTLSTICHTENLLIKFSLRGEPCEYPQFHWRMARHRLLKHETHLSPLNLGPDLHELSYSQTDTTGLDTVVMGF